MDKNLNICAVICEFNPFHNGHKYLLENARRLSQADVILCVMSGNFVQRAEPAIIDKFARTRAALLNGADMVLQIPTLYATANGQQFAHGAISMISAIKGVTHLAFGCENDDLTLLKTIAQIQSDEPAILKDNLSSLLMDGISYANAYAKSTAIALKSLYNIDIMPDIVLKMPNNLLAIEYLKQLYIKKSNILPLAIKRIGGDYNDTQLCTNFSSASAIRQVIESGDKSCDLNILTKDSLPANTIELICGELEKNPICKDIFDAIIVEHLLNDDLGLLAESAEGLDIRLKKSAKKDASLDMIIKSTKSKRYTMSRIRRLCLHSVLGVEKYIACNKDFLPPFRLLGVKKERLSMLANLPFCAIKRNSDISQMLKSYGDSRSNAEYILKIDQRADNFYCVMSAKKPYGAMPFICL